MSLSVDQVRLKK